MTNLNQTYAGWKPGDIVRYRRAGKLTYCLDWVGSETVQMHDIRRHRRTAMAVDLERVATAENIRAGDPAHVG